MIRQALERRSLAGLTDRHGGNATHIQLRLHVLLERAHSAQGCLIRVDQHHFGQWGARGEIVPFAQRTSLLDDTQHHPHIRLHDLVHSRCVNLWDHEEVDRLEGARHDKLKILVHVLGEEGRERRHHAAKHHHHLEECVQRRVPLIAAGVPCESLLVHANVPIGQVVDELDQPGNYGIQTIRLHLRTHEFDETVCRGQDPAVH
mmetsp:Transcript_20687/g.63286  ORF Transcript_20687/g.63286 Transcript_20687/m.63286 type:complete len:203 (+) Transcript_20687:1145-1753(+)|eukprot:scaffold105693_cov32-Tisochrysis_lutea.AAC.2